MSNTENDYLWDRSGPEDPEVARLEELLSPLRHTAPLDELRLRRRSRKSVWIAGASVFVAAAAVAILVWKWPATSGGVLDAGAVAANPCAGGAGFAFVAQGNVSCNETQVSRGTLPVKGTLDTLASTAELAIATIGNAKLSPGTRIRLDKTSVERHELYLERGRMRAFVIAEPELFAVGTPSAQVTDLGCEYTLDIKDDGSGSVVVHTGKVRVASRRIGSTSQADDMMVVLYAGMRANLLAGRRAGVPLVDGANARLVAAAEAWERDPASRIDDILAAATKHEAFTLVNLLDLAPAADRRRILDRIGQLRPPPQGVTVDEALEEPAYLKMWLLAIKTDFLNGEN